MATPTPTNPTLPAGRGPRAAHLIGILAVLAPAAYLTGRFSAAYLAGTYFSFVTPVVVATSLGMLVGIPVGLFFGSQKVPAAPAPAVHPHSGNILKQEPEILAQIKQELSQIKVLFEPRKGNQSLLSRIAYPTEYWNALKASGQLFVMSNPALMNTIAGAYYWVEQASRLENLAFESRYSGAVVDNQNATTHLLADARMLDGPLETSLNAALNGIDAALDAANTAPIPA